MATPSSMLAWEIPRTEEPGGPQSVGSHRVGHDLTCTHGLGDVDSDPIISVIKTSE